MEREGIESDGEGKELGNGEGQAERKNKEKKNSEKRKQICFPMLAQIYTYAINLYNIITGKYIL